MCVLSVGLTTTSPLAAIAFPAVAQLRLIAAMPSRARVSSCRSCVLRASSSARV
jgi:hypothetical protein